MIYEKWGKSSSKPEKDIKTFLLNKYGKDGVEVLEKERGELSEKAKNMNELYNTHKDLTTFSALDKEDFYDYE